MMVSQSSWSSKSSSYIYSSLPLEACLIFTNVRHSWFHNLHLQTAQGFEASLVFDLHLIVNKAHPMLKVIADESVKVGLIFWHHLGFWKTATLTSIYPHSPEDTTEDTHPLLSPSEMGREIYRFRKYSFSAARHTLDILDHTEALDEYLSKLCLFPRCVFSKSDIHELHKQPGLTSWNQNLSTAPHFLPRSLEHISGTIDRLFVV